MTNILAQICEDKKKHIAERKAKISENSLMKFVSGNDRNFKKALDDKIKNKSTALIAELKKASPSKGIIRENFNPSEIAIAYEKGGATCLSVLTDEKYFQGKDEYIRQVKNSVDLPILRKDFILDVYQVLESRVLGANCILIIMAAVDDKLAQDLIQSAHSFGMDVLIEIHNLEELERALKLDNKLIGVNNRDLKTLEISLATTEQLIQHIPAEYTVVCESGIEEQNDILRMKNSGVYSFLVGSSLMQQNNIEKAVQKLID